VANGRSTDTETDSFPSVWGINPTKRSSVVSGQASSLRAVTVMGRRGVLKRASVLMRAVLAKTARPFQGDSRSNQEWQWERYGFCGMEEQPVRFRVFRNGAQSM
jgi:hypothetical protein